MRKAEDDFTDTAYFKSHGIDPVKLYDIFWQHSGDWVEPPNKRRGGWSGVYRYHLQGSAEKPRDILYVKVQHAHYASSLPGMRGELTLNREIRMLRRASAAGVHVPQCVYFVHQGEDAILATRELEGFIALDDLQQRVADGFIGRSELTRLTGAIAEQMARLHAARIRHNKPSGQHVMVNPATGQAAIIDWEMAKHSWSIRKTRRRDLSILARDTTWAGRRQQVQFLRRYLGVQRLNDEAKHLYRQLAARVQEKLDVLRRRQQQNGPGA